MSSPHLAVQFWELVQLVSQMVSRGLLMRNRNGDKSYLSLAAFGLVLAAPQPAQALKIASQESTGGMLSGGGNMVKSSTAASMEGKMTYRSLAC